MPIQFNQGGDIWVMRLHRGNLTTHDPAPALVIPFSSLSEPNHAAMVDLDEIIENSREGEDQGSGHEGGGGPTHRNIGRPRRPRKRSNFCGSRGSIKSHLTSGSAERRGGVESGRWNASRQADYEQHDVLSVQEDHQAEFYKDYRRVSEEYDREFLDKYEEDLNTTLVFAGLFSAVTSAFIIQLDSQLQSDPNEETAALLRILIYKIDNTTFGNNIPTIPQWAGPPRTVVQVQAILLTSLFTSLFSAFLAMLGKQWLNRYASTDMRGSAADRSQSRQRKLDGIVVWYFYYVMELLPLMLQAALLLLGSALSLYLWEIDVTIASVTLGITSLGAILYLFFVVAGTISESCPYQTPTSHILRFLWSRIYIHASRFPALRFIASTLRNASMKSRIVRTVVANARCYHPWWPISNIVPFSKDLVMGIPVAFANDAHQLGRSTLRTLAGLPIRGRRLARWISLHFCHRSNTSERRSDWKRIVLDLRCMSWILRTTLDKSIHLSTFKHLVSVPELADFDPALVVDCFDNFVSCINIVNHEVVTIQGLEELAAMSARSLFRTFHHLSVVNPTSGVLANLRQRYDKVFPTNKITFSSLPFRYTMLMIHAMFKREWNPCYVEWDRPTSQEQLPFARYMAETAQLGYRRLRCRKVPRWILRFALFSLALDPPSSPPVIADCLTIVAIDLGCDVSSTEALDDCERVEHVSSIITKTLRATVDAANSDFILSKRKAISTLFPYAICLGLGGQQGMADAISRAAEACTSGGFVWHRVRRHIATLFDNPIHPSLNRVITLASCQVPWDGSLHDEDTIVRWAATVSTVPYTREIGQSVVDALLQIAHIDSLRPHIPVDVWAWLKERPPPLPLAEGRPEGSVSDVIRHIRGLGDVEILKSYFFHTLSEWAHSLDDSCFTEIQISIREDFCGAGMQHHRADLIAHLDRRLEDLEEFSEYVDGIDEVEREVEHYQKLRDALLEVEGEARETPGPTPSHSGFSCALPLLCT